LETDAMGQNANNQSTPSSSHQSVTVLFLAANPSTTTRLRLDEEVRAIDQALRQANYREQFDLRQHWAVRVADLQELLLRHQPHIVHFSGHGSEAGQLLLEDDRGREFAVPPDALSRLFAILRDRVRCVVLNACYSEPQAQAIAAHIDCVIGMPDAIGDAASRNFAASFYQALGYGRDVQTAFDLGCNRIDLQALDEPSKPKLLAQRGDPRQVVFVVPQQAPTSAPPPAASLLSPSQRRHLEAQLTELEKRRATLTRRIDALDTDIGREIDSERKLVLQERRAALSSEREQVASQLASLEQQLASGGSVSASSAAPAQAPLAASLSPAERGSLERQLAEGQANLRLIEERKAQYVLETDVPLQLLKDEGRLRQRIAELEARLGLP
jgi:hypothetical protein